MKSNFSRPLIVACVIFLLPVITLAGWPWKIFAPYMYIGAGDHFKLTDCNDACGVKYFTLAFLIAQQEPAVRALAWDGKTPLEQNLYADQIEAIRKRGGDVIASFGGEAGKELAIVEPDPSELQLQYQAAIDRYHFTWLDFDIEGANLDRNQDATRRRNAVLANLQKSNAQLRISFTLPVDTTGLSRASLALLSDAVGKGVCVHSVDLMVMYFGKPSVASGKSEARLGIDAATIARSQLADIDPSILIGLCPCIGANGDSGERFTLADAKELREFADGTPWVCSLHFWSINDDAGQVGGRKKGIETPWAFARTFETFGQP